MGYPHPAYPFPPGLFAPCQVGVWALAMLAIRQHELDLMMIKSSSLFLSYTSRSKLTHSLSAT